MHLKVFLKGFQNIPTYPSTAKVTCQLTFNVNRSIKKYV